MCFATVVKYLYVKTLEEALDVPVVVDSLVSMGIREIDLRTHFRTPFFDKIMMLQGQAPCILVLFVIILLHFDMLVRFPMSIEEENAFSCIIHIVVSNVNINTHASIGFIKFFNWFFK